VFFAFVALLVIAILMFNSSSGHIATRWGAGLALSGAAGFFATVVEETLRPWFAAHYPASPWIDVVLLIIKNTGSVTTQLVLPYAFLMFALYSYDSIANGMKKRIALLATLPVIVTILFALPLYPMVVFNYTYVTLWVGPYMLTAAGLLFAAYYKEKHPSMRLDKLFAFCTASIPMLFDLYTGFIARILGDYDAFRMNVYMIILLFVSYIFLTIKYGFLGLKINLVQRRMDKSLQVAHDMSAMYNHTIKNELAKLVFYLSRMEVAEKSEADLGSIKQAVSQITHMSAQIQKQSRRIQLQPGFFSVQHVVEQALCSVIPTLQKKQIEVVTNLLAPDTLYCDMIHTVEVLENLLNNACEAMEPGGRIVIRVVESKKYIVMSVRDTGPGIAEDVQGEIFQPFYSTKANSQNYGLGLSYCYQVMQQHKGKIEVFSDGKSGTTFFLQFPKRKQRKNQTV
jgi:two-component system sporulation sensor kinase B